MTSSLLQAHTKLANLIKVSNEHRNIPKPIKDGLFTLSNLISHAIKEVTETDNRSTQLSSYVVDLKDRIKLSDQLTQTQDTAIQALRQSNAEKGTMIEVQKDLVTTLAQLLKQVADRLPSDDDPTPDSSLAPGSLSGTFASRVASSVQPMPNQVIVKALPPKDKSPPMSIKDMKSSFNSYFPRSELRNQNIVITKFRLGPKSLSIHLETRCQVDKLIKMINDHSDLSKRMLATKINLRNPSIYLPEIDSEVDPTQLVSQILEDNPEYEINESEIALITTRHRRATKNNSDPGYDAYLTLSSSLFSRINKKPLKVGNSLSMVSESFHVTQCLHCVDIDHSTSKCTNHTIHHQNSNNRKFYKRCRTCSTILTSPVEFKAHLDAHNCSAHCHMCQAKNLDAHHNPLSDQCKPYIAKMNFLRSNTNYDSSCHDPVTGNQLNSDRLTSKPNPTTPSSAPSAIVSPT